MSTIPTPASPSAAPVSRRNFVLGSLLGAGAMTLGGIAYRVAALPDGKPAVQGGVLTRQEMAAAVALSLALFPPGNPFDIDGAQADVAGYLDRYLQRLPSAEQKLIRALIWLYDQGTVMVGSLRPIRSMPQAAAQAYVQGWESSGFQWRRDLAMSLRTVMGFGYFAHPKVKAAIYYQEQCAAGGPSLLGEGARS